MIVGLSQYFVAVPELYCCTANFKLNFSYTRYFDLSLQKDELCRRRRNVPNGETLADSYLQCTCVGLYVNLFLDARRSLGHL